MLCFRGKFTRKASRRRVRTRKRRRGGRKGKGALDGGVDIPYSEKRFVGFSEEDKSLNAGTQRKYILGGHIADYMKEEEPEKYLAHFSGLLKEGLEADDLPEM
ncbi:hypothetical protein BDL97_06G019400 [Sphagnum fallax]|nr:hypothetical protein BDL97_06G019400 [Sphagnum fallax]